MYAIKFLLRGESPRDHVDILRSFMHQPTISISDIPGFIARHGNKRYPEMFSPNDGKFIEANDVNLTKLKEGTLSVSLPQLDPKFSGGTHEATLDHSYSIPEHPITKNRDHYAAYDRFHECNTSSLTEQLRRLDIVPQCQSVNSQVAEEFFSKLQKSCYFLTQMSPLHHLFVVRLICHFHNIERNQSMMTELKKNLRDCDIQSVVTEMDDCRMKVDSMDCEIEGLRDCDMQSVLTEIDSRRMKVDSRYCEGEGTIQL